MIRRRDWIIFGAIVVCLLWQMASARQLETPAANQPSKLTKLLDWESYRNLFKKRYSSMQQEMVRQKIFMARAMEVFKTSLKYLMNKIGHWHSINKFSDWTYNETRRFLHGDWSKPQLHEFTDETLAERLLMENLESSQVSEQQTRSKREAAPEEAPEEHMLSTINLIGSEKEISPDSVENLKMFTPSNNPSYKFWPRNEVRIKERVAEDIETSAFEETLERLESLCGASWSYVKTGWNMLYDYATSPSQTEPPPKAEWDLASAIEMPSPQPAKEETKVEVIRDWRESGCIGPVKNQEICNCCYAMSSTSYMEWALCMNQGNVLTPLSVQYMVSCGKQFRAETEGRYQLMGCELGVTSHASAFFRDYGLELEANMHYVDFELECPVPTHWPRKDKGYIRPNLNEPVRLKPNTDRLDLALKVGPVIVSMRVPIDFLQYGGGIIEGCEPGSGHSMLIVGNAIEDGVEYLLIKNSFGNGWGHDGYVKFKRSGAKYCVKEYISPSVNFPSEKSTARHIKAYFARQDKKDKAYEEFHEIGSGEIQKLYE